MAVGRRAALNAPHDPRRAKTAATTRLYTAQDVADFCEVDLKTIHHWADRGKIVSHRTEGRHLRFRRNDVVRFLRGLDYPLPDALLDVKPLVFLGVEADPAWAVPPPELAKKLAPRFGVKTFPHALAAIAHLHADEPDALVVSTTDPTIAGAATLAALKETAPWLVVAAVGLEAATDVVVLPEGVARLGQDLGRALAISRT